MNDQYAVEKKESALREPGIGSLLVKEMDNLVDARRCLFDIMQERLLAPPDRIDEIFCQTPEWEELTAEVNDPENGTLIVKCRQFFPDGSSCEYIYSVFYIGDILRIGVLIKDIAYADAPNRSNNDMTMRHVWGEDHGHNIFFRGDGFLYEWVFKADPRDVLKMEFYAKGIRHMHYQVARIMADYNCARRSMVAEACSS